MYYFCILFNMSGVSREIPELTQRSTRFRRRPSYLYSVDVGTPRFFPTCKKWATKVVKWASLVSIGSSSYFNCLVFTQQGDLRSNPETEVAQVCSTRQWVSTYLESDRQESSDKPRSFHSNLIAVLPDVIEMKNQPIKGWFATYRARTGETKA